LFKAYGMDEVMSKDNLQQKQYTDPQKKKESKTQLSKKSKPTKSDKKQGNFLNFWTNLNKSFKYIILLIVIILIVLAVWKFQEEPETEYITSSSLQEAIAVEELSTAEFIYNGIAEKEKIEDSGDYYYISYDSVVSVGIDMSQVEFTIDHENKIVHTELPVIKLNIVSIDPESLDYLPENPKLELDEIINLCKEDAISEANQSEFLYETAEESLKATIKALLTPILNEIEYTIEWSNNG